jgi:hypothetical protein
MTEPASDKQRRYNRRSTQRRNEWRVQYALVTQAIRSNRDQLRAAHRGGKLNPMAHTTLRSLRHTAYLMMLDREVIGMDLRDSAYRWV